MPSAPSIAASPTPTDLLRRLFAIEQGSLFRFMEARWSYLDKAHARYRQPLMEMVQSSRSNSAALAECIVAAGGAIGRTPVDMSEQYLAFLSFDFLIPKLIEAQQAAVVAYEQVLKSAKLFDAKTRSLLEGNLAGHRAQLAMLAVAAPNASDNNAENLDRL